MVHDLETSMTVPIILHLKIERFRDQTRFCRKLYHGGVLKLSLDLANLMPPAVGTAA